MRSALSIVVIAVALLLGSAPAAASCAPPVSVADNAARATAVVQGIVTSVNGGALTVRVTKVFKGQAASTVRVYIGPGRGSVAATSVDYSAAANSEHVLYVTRVSDGQLETNACVGSHPGPATADEIAVLGPGAAPAGGSSDAGDAGELAFSPELSPLWLALIVAAAGGAALLLIRSRRPLR